MATRIRAKTARVTVYQSRIQKAFTPGETPFRNMQRVGRVNEKHAKNLAPVRTGRLKKQIRMTAVSYSPSTYQFRYTVNTNTDYAIFTLVTTPPVITSNRPGGLLWVRPWKYSWFPYNKRFAHKGGRTPLFWVRGYAGDDWLKKAIYLTFKEERLL